MELFEEGNNFEDVFNFEPEDAPKQAKKEKKNAKKKNKVDYVKTMEAALATPFICKNHEGVHMKIRESTKNPPLCGSCGFKCEGKSGFISCPKTNACFSLCTSCKICPKNHVLRNCASLTNFSDKNSSYGNDMFTCGGCSVEKKVGPEGVFHCPFCSWSVCTPCIDNLNDFWRKKSEDAEENNVDG